MAVLLLKQQPQNIIMVRVGLLWIPPMPGVFSRLAGVATVATDNAWAVGSYFDSSDSTTKTLIQHWDGSIWSTITSPNQSSATNNSLHGITAISSSNIWAVGSYQSSTDNQDHVLIEHYDGTSWSIVSGGGITNESSSVLSGITTISSSNIWAV